MTRPVSLLELLAKRVLQLALVLAVLLLARAACAQPAATVLARAVVAEAGWHAPDHAAILGVLELRARRAGVAIEAMARRYVSAFRVRPTRRLRWVLELEPACEQPPSWPARLDWAAHQPQCLQTFERVAAFERGELRSPCPRAVHWGGRDLEPDATRAARAGWRQARCSVRTRNVFYRAGSTLSAAVARGKR
jgi:hypothetical protein